MGTAILAVATYGNPGAMKSFLPTAHLLGVVLAVLVYALAAVWLAGLPDPVDPPPRSGGRGPA